MPIFKKAFPFFRAAISAAALCLLAALACGSASANATIGVMTGYVYQPDGVTPAGGIAVQVYASASATLPVYTTLTLPNGAYTLPVLQGTYYVGAVSPIYGAMYFDQRLSLSLSQAVGVPARTQVDGIDVIFPDPTTTATLDGAVGLQGRGSKPDARWSVPLHVVITPDGGGVPVFDGSLTTDANGQLTLHGVPPGVYRIYVKHSHTLATALTTTLTAGGNALDFGTLREGDADDDNRIIIGDFAILAAAFGTTSGMAGYDARADFNLDGAVTILDFSLLAANFGQVGAPLTL